MAELTDELKREIVRRLACFETLESIITTFRKEHDLDLSPRQVGSYDPTRNYFEAGEWAREFFELARKEYVTNASAVPCANQGFRLNVLQQGIEAATKARNWKLAAELAEQASKEMGGAYTNSREVSISDSRRQRAVDMTPEDRQALLADVIRKAIETMPPQPGQAPQHPTPQ